MDKTSNYLAIMVSEMLNFEPGEKIIVENQKKLQIILATVAEIVHNNLIGTVVEINVEDTSNIEYKLNGGRLTIMTVSYTHQDVYKRQVWGIPARRCFGLQPATGSSFPSPWWG